MTRIGYERVSTGGQNPEGQHDRLTAVGCEKIFTDKGESGRKAHRPQWDACRTYLREGDTLVCTRLDRIGRWVQNLIEVVNDLGERGIDLVVLDQAIDITTASGKFLFHIMAAVAEFERDLIASRIRDGLAAAWARGRAGGRKAKLSPAQAAHVVALYDAGGKTYNGRQDVQGDRRDRRHLAEVGPGLRPAGPRGRRMISLSAGLPPLDALMPPGVWPQSGLDEQD